MQEAFSSRFVGYNFEERPYFYFSNPLSLLNRLGKFCELLLQDGLSSEYAYLFSLKNAYLCIGINSAQIQDFILSCKLKE
jgi:hypothetical protein